MSTADDPRNHSADTNNVTNTTRVKTPGPQIDPSDLEDEVANGNMASDTGDDPENILYDPGDTLDIDDTITDDPDDERRDEEISES
jgi:hypothetical protein